MQAEFCMLVLEIAIRLLLRLAGQIAARNLFPLSSVTRGVFVRDIAAQGTVGIVGLAAFTVAARTKQLGTRRAIGATRFQIVRYFLVENWIITSAGSILALAVGIKLSEIYATNQELDASVAGMRVGYESGSQFSREYRHLFGAPPRRDIERLRFS
jgi:AraC-like DNA-binding protein